ncbi:hypothetical protein CFP56_003940 [Quercus suber]|uniref:Uncharacterized protein n=2 Tax=Mesangiospermae TaxID=1437183 RepID=A0AAW0IIE2_QUESU
MEALVYTFL